MLKLRVITAVVLLAILLPLLFQPQPEPFVWAALLMVSAGAWEWGRMNGLRFAISVIAATLWGALVCLAWQALGWSGNMPLWTLTTLIWVAAAFGLLQSGVGSWQRVPVAVRLFLGWCLLALAWLALKQARELGVNFLLSTMALVWVADISAYFGGRAWGKRKLAPTISPGKSWAGVYSGVGGVFLLALAWMWLDAQVPVDSASLYTQLQSAHPIAMWPGLLLLTGMSVAGDLLESLVKRSAGCKDSSQLLPGHGGVLDRLDALLPVLPMAVLFAGL